MIILIGMDNTGKTTLAENLNRGLEDLYVIKSIGPTGDHEPWVLKQLANDHGSKIIVYDRFPLFEEMVYGPILRGQSKFNMDHDLVRLLKKQNPLIVYMRPEAKFIFDFQKEEMAGVIENSERLLRAYDDLCFKLIADNWNIITFDYNKHEPQRVLQFHSYNAVGGI